MGVSSPKWRGVRESSEKDEAQSTWALTQQGINILGFVQKTASNEGPCELSGNWLGNEQFLGEVGVRVLLMREQVWWPSSFLLPLAAFDWTLSFQNSIPSSVYERAKLDHPAAFSDCKKSSVKEYVRTCPFTVFWSNRLHYHTIHALVMDTQGLRGRKNFMVSIYLNFKPLFLLLNDVTPNK